MTGVNYHPCHLNYIKMVNQNKISNNKEARQFLFRSFVGMSALSSNWIVRHIAVWLINKDLKKKGVKTK